MSSTELARQLDDLHRRLLAGSRTASRDLFVAALAPVTAFIAKSQPALRDDQAHDIATDAILMYLREPKRCDLTRASLWTYLCMVASADAIDQFRTQVRRRQLLEQSASDVADWTLHANHSAEVDRALDAKRIMDLHGHRLASSDSDRRVLTLILDGERATSAFAEALGLELSDGETEALVKQAKDRMKLRLKRLRDAL